MLIPAEQRTDGCMNIIQVIDVIRDLAHSQGFYSRLYERILNCAEHNPDLFKDFKEAIESQNFKDPLDVVMYFES